VHGPLRERWYQVLVFLESFRFVAIALTLTVIEMAIAGTFLATGDLLHVESSHSDPEQSVPHHAKMLFWYEFGLNVLLIVEFVVRVLCYKRCFPNGFRRFFEVRDTRRFSFSAAPVV
jgi:hypothetical protein